ncbi:MAG: peptidoglycan bridge formation glycyltransferase FemA/FemB family protein [Armatimonadetes bacterium]|nr:peptidoglycan bridge formation glycyltransferase FemA/FemB family protein [Armatimonadota bacterium]
MKAIIKDHWDPEEWNKWVASSPSGTIFQTTHWAAVMGERNKWAPRYLVVRDHESKQPSALLLFFKKKFLDVPLSGANARGLTRLVRELFPSYTWLYGPLFLGEEDQTAAKCLLSALDKKAQEDGIHFVDKVRLPCHDMGSEASLWAPSFLEAGYRIEREEATLLLDLRCGEEDLMSRYRQSARKAIRRARDEGIQIKEISTLWELSQYYAFFKRASRRKDIEGFRVPPWQVFRSLWKHLQPDACLRFFAAHRGNETLCGLGIWKFNGIWTEFFSVQSEKSFREKLYGNDLLKDEILRTAVREGARVYDLAGISPDPATPKESGIRRFKEKWGGEKVTIRMFGKTCRYSLLGRTAHLVRKLKGENR